jgi:hypothetical protein
MRASEFISEQIVQALNLEEEIVTWKRVGKKIIPRFRCPSGPRKGRVVPDISQCYAHPDIKKSEKFKLTRAKKGAAQARKTKRTKRVNPVSKLASRLNRLRKK